VKLKKNKISEGGNKVEYISNPDLEITGNVKYIWKNDETLEKSSLFS